MSAFAARDPVYMVCVRAMCICVAPSLCPTPQDKQKRDQRVDFVSYLEQGPMGAMGPMGPMGCLGPMGLMGAMGAMARDATLRPRAKIDELPKNPPREIYRLNTSEFHIFMTFFCFLFIFVHVEHHFQECRNTTAKE